MKLLKGREGEKDIGYSSTIILCHTITETKGSDEHSLPLIFLSNMDVVVSPSDVRLSEESSVLHVVNQLGGEEQRVPTVNCVCYADCIIKSLAVHTQV